MDDRRDLPDEVPEGDRIDRTDAEPLLPAMPLAGAMAPVGGVAAVLALGTDIDGPESEEERGAQVEEDDVRQR